VGDALDIRSRDDRPFDRYYPEVERLVLGRGGPDYVVDGEIVVVRPEGFGFDELLQRIHPAASRVKMLTERWPATLIVFDALELGGEDLRARPTSPRYPSGPTCS
jgi:ATP-dependent DNA ligase